MKILTDTGLMVLWQRIKDLYKKTSVSAKQTTTSTADGGTNVMTFTFGDGTSTTLSVKNGSKGSTGARGATGAKGEKGDRGPIGETGPQGNSGIADASSKALINDAVTGGETSYLSAEVGKLGILTYDCSKGGSVTHVTLQDAINSVPTTFQKVGLTITYKSSDTIYRYVLKANSWSADPTNWYSVEDQLSKISDFINDVCFLTYKLGNPINSQLECIVNYAFKKGYTYFITIQSAAKINPLFSIKNKSPFTLEKENLTETKEANSTLSTLFFSYKPDENVVGLGAWVDTSEYNKNVFIRIKCIKNTEPTYVIVDTDCCGDIDDLFALRVLAQAEKSGKIILVGINANVKNTDTATGIDGFMCHEGINDICIGIDHEASESRSLFLDKCALHYHTYNSNDDCEDSVSFFNRALDFIPDESKAIVLTLGLYNSMKRVFSDSSLKTKFAKKINKVYCMGGNFSDPTYKEYNFGVSIENTRSFINNCPVPIYFVGFETCGKIMGGKVLGENGYTFDLLQKALLGFYREWGYTITTPMERNAPDAIAAMIAIADDTAFYNLIYSRGKVSINDNGTCSFVQNKQNGNHYVVWVNNTSDYPYEEWVKSMEKRLSDVMLRLNEGLVSNTTRLARY